VSDFPIVLDVALLEYRDKITKSQWHGEGLQGMLMMVSEERFAQQCLLVLLACYEHQSTSKLISKPPFVNVLTKLNCDICPPKYINHQ
jgi:hypothetical protein